jgi:hypothetical protein
LKGVGIWQLAVLIPFGRTISSLSAEVKGWMVAPAHPAKQIVLAGRARACSEERALPSSSQLALDSDLTPKYRPNVNCRRKTLIAIGVMLGLAVLIPVIHHYQLRAATEAYIAELKAQGEPMELAQVIPRPLPPEQNSAPLFLKAVSLLSTNDDDNVLVSNPPSAMRSVAPGKAMIGWQQPDIRFSDETNSWADIQNALAQDNEAFKYLGEITNHALFDFDLQYTQLSEMRLTHLILEKRAVQRLSAKTLCDLRDGDTGAAIKSVQTMLALVDGTGDERTAISQLVRIAIAQIAAATTWEILQSTNLTDGQLASLQDDWSELEFIQASENTLPVERECGETDLAMWRSSNLALQHYFDIGKKAREAIGESDEEDSLWNKTKIKARIFLWRYWWSYPDELRSLKGFEVLINTHHLVETNGSFQTALEHQKAALDELGISKMDSSFDNLFTGKTDFHTMMSEPIVTLGKVIERVMRAEVTKHTAVAAIALKRYQLKYGNYPPDLKSLVPEFVSTIPIDPVDGQPLRFRLSADESFLLYSIGPNGKDDGGSSSPDKEDTSQIFFWESQNALDWVWPQPATQEEIRKYYHK